MASIILHTHRYDAAQSLITLLIQTSILRLHSMICKIKEPAGRYFYHTLFVNYFWLNPSEHCGRLYFSLWNEELWVSESISFACGLILIQCVVFQAAVFMKSPGSSVSRPLKARETTTMKGVAALTVSWAMAGGIKDRGGVGGPQCPQTLEGHMPTSEHCIGVGGGYLQFFITTMTYNKPALSFVFVKFHHWGADRPDPAFHMHVRSSKLHRGLNVLVSQKLKAYCANCQTQ